MIVFKALLITTIGVLVSLLKEFQNGDTYRDKWDEYPQAQLYQILTFPYLFWVF